VVVLRHPIRLLTLPAIVPDFPLLLTYASFITFGCFTGWAKLRHLRCQIESKGVVVFSKTNTMCVQPLTKFSHPWCLFSMYVYSVASINFVIFLLLVRGLEELKNKKTMWRQLLYIRLFLSVSYYQ